MYFYTPRDSLMCCYTPRDSLMCCYTPRDSLMCCYTPVYKPYVIDHFVQYETFVIHYIYIVVVNLVVVVVVE